MPTFPAIKPNLETDWEMISNVSVVKLGSGEHRMPMGRDYIKYRTNLIFTNKTAAEKDTLKAFLADMAGGAEVTYTSGYESTARSWCLDGTGKITAQGGDNYTIQFALRTP